MAAGAVLGMAGASSKTYRGETSQSISHTTLFGVCIMIWYFYIITYEIYMGQDQIYIIWVKIENGTVKTDNDSTKSVTSVKLEVDGYYVRYHSILYLFIRDIT